MQMSKLEESGSLLQTLDFSVCEIILQVYFINIWKGSWGTWVA